MVMEKTDNNIVHLYSHGKIDELNKLYNQILLDRIKIDMFLTKFLDMFERKMSYEQTQTPVWNLYRKKMNDHEKISRLESTARYFLNKSGRSVQNPQ